MQVLLVDWGTGSTDNEVSTISPIVTGKDKPSFIFQCESQIMIATIQKIKLIFSFETEINYAGCANARKC